jgi:hypothetical protein
MPTLSSLSRIYIVRSAGKLHKDLLCHSLSCVRKEQMKIPFTIWGEAISEEKSLELLLSGPLIFFRVLRI